MTSGAEVDLNAVKGSEHGDGNVASGAALLSFTEAVLGRDQAALSESRAALLTAIGAAGIADVAGVIGAFEMMNRVANATGTPLDEPLVAQTAGVLPFVGADDFASAPESSDS